MKKILIIEDDRALNKGITFNLKEEGFDVKGVYSLFEGRLEIEKDYDLIILDVNLPDGSGFDLCSEIRLKNKNTAIIFLSACDMEFDIVNGFKLGADDYITKPFNLLELIARVKSNLRRYVTLGNYEDTCKEILKSGALELNTLTKEVKIDGENIKMTPIEYKIIELLLENKGRVFSIDEIYEKVWNEESFNSENTVAVHIRRIREKIEINPKEPRFLKVVWGVGYKIEKQ
mgnify:CR=1 FL=1